MPIYKYRDTKTGQTFTVNSPVDPTPEQITAEQAKVNSPNIIDSMGGARGIAATGVRGLAGLGSSMLSMEPGVGTVLGAGTAGAGEGIAQQIEGGLGSPLNWKRIGVEAGLGAVPLGKVIPVGKFGAAVAGGGILGGAGEAMREKANDQPIDTTGIMGATGLGAFTGGLASRIFSPTTPTKPTTEPSAIPGAVRSGTGFNPSTNIPEGGWSLQPSHARPEVPTKLQLAQKRAYSIQGAMDTFVDPDEAAVAKEAAKRFGLAKTSVNIAENNELAAAGVKPIASHQTTAEPASAIKPAPIADRLDNVANKASEQAGPSTVGSQQKPTQSPIEPPPTATAGPAAGVTRRRVVEPSAPSVYQPPGPTIEPGVTGAKLAGRVYGAVKGNPDIDPLIKRLMGMTSVHGETNPGAVEQFVNEKFIPGTRPPPATAGSPPIEPGIPPSDWINQQLGIVNKLQKLKDESGQASLGLLTNPMTRAMIGGTAGATGGQMIENQSDEWKQQHPFLSQFGPYSAGMLGAMAGGMADPRLLTAAGRAEGGLESARKVGEVTKGSMYEGILAGRPILTHAAGKVGAGITAPILEAIRGNTQGSKDLLSTLMNPEAYGRGWEAAKAGFKEPVQTGVPNELPQVQRAGPVAKLFSGMNEGGRSILKEGLSPSGAEGMADKYALLNRPSTTIANRMLGLWRSIPLVGTALSPFAPTLTRLTEMAGATSPLRLLPDVSEFGAASKLGRQLRGHIPVAEGASHPNVRNAALASIAPVAAYAGYKGALPFLDSTKSALMGSATVPFKVGQAVHNADELGGSKEDYMRSILQQLPLIDAASNLSTADPNRIIGEILSRPMPSGMVAAGHAIAGTPNDYRMPSTIEDYFKDKLPWERGKLPIRPDYFGKPIERTALGGQPPPLWSTDPTASKLAEMGQLRRAQSTSVSPPATTGQQKSDVQQLRGQSMEKLIKQAMADPKFQSLSPEQQVMVIKAIKEAGSQEGTALFQANQPASYFSQKK